MRKTLTTPAGTFYLRPYQDEDMQPVIGLWERVFGRAMDERVWRWKFHDCPFGRHTMLCLDETHAPIALYAGIAFRANWQGRSIRMAHLVDNMSHPACRHLTSGRKGLFVQTAEHFFDTYGSGPEPVFYYGFPGRRHSRLGELLLHYGTLAGGAAYLEKRVSKISLPRPTSKNVERLHSATHELDELWNRAKAHYPLSVARDAQFVQWRFFDRPAVDYHVYGYRSEEGLGSWAVVRFDGAEATLVDMLALPDEQGLRDIIRTIAGQCTKKRLRILRAWLPSGHFLRNMLLRHGFKDRQEPLGIVPTGRSFIRGLDIDYASANIYYTMADADLY